MATKKATTKKVATDAPKTEKQVSFDIMAGTTVIRTYSVKVHGKKAQELAKMFAKKKGYTVK